MSIHLYPVRKHEELSSGLVFFSSLDNPFDKETSDFRGGDAIYNIATVSAGPAGLMTAKTTTEDGLNIVAIENVSKITRAILSYLM